jgi:hypothetical protein
MLQEYLNNGSPGRLSPKKESVTLVSESTDTITLPKIAAKAKKSPSNFNPFALKEKP